MYIRNVYNVPLFIQWKQRWEFIDEKSFKKKSRHETTLTTTLSIKFKEKSYKKQNAIDQRKEASFKKKTTIRNHRTIDQEKNQVFLL